MRKTLIKGAKRYCIGNGQIRGNTAHNCIMGSEEIFSNFSDSKGDNRSFIPAHLPE